MNNSRTYTTTEMSRDLKIDRNVVLNRLQDYGLVFRDEAKRTYTPSSFLTSTGLAVMKGGSLRWTDLGVTAIANMVEGISAT